MSAEVAQAITKSVAPLLSRCESLNSKVDKTHAKLAAGLRVNVNHLEAIMKDLSEVKEAIRSMTGNFAATLAHNMDQTFPLKTKVEVEQYLDSDPDAKLAMER